MSNKRRVKKDKVTFGALEGYRRSLDLNPVELTFGEGDAAITVQVKKVIDVATFGSAVKAVGDACFDEEGNYLAWMYDYAYRHVVLSAYTNLTLPSDFQKESKYLYGNGIYEKVERTVDTAQLAALCTATIEEVRARAEERSDSRRQELDQAITMLKMLTNKYEEILKLCQGIMGDDIHQLAERLQASAQDVSGEVQAVKDKLAQASSGESAGGQG